jgi:hypothetical protein
MHPAHSCAVNHAHTQQNHPYLCITTPFSAASTALLCPAGSFQAFTPLPLPRPMMGPRMSFIGAFLGPRVNSTIDW